MSYNASVIANRDELHAKLGEAVAAVEHQPSDAHDERNDHLTAALTVLDRILEAVGRPEDDVSVTIAGHANPGHAPREGWSGDQLTIIVMAKAAAAAPEQAPTP